MLPIIISNAEVVNLIKRESFASSFSVVFAGVALIVVSFQTDSNSFRLNPIEKLVDPRVDAGKGRVSALHPEGGDADDGVAAELE